MLFAKKSCSKRYTKCFEWSPALVQHMEAVHYWRLLLKHAKGPPIRPSTILRAKVSANLSDEPDTIDLPLIIRSLCTALLALWSAQKMHIELHEA